MRLNVMAWTEKDIRPSMHGMQFRLMDFKIEKPKWFFMDEILGIAERDGIRDSKVFREFRTKALNREEEIKKIVDEHLFEKKILKTYSNEKNIIAEIVEYHYGDIIGAPRLMKSLAFNDFYYKNPGWGIEDEMLIDAKSLGVEDIYLIDDYNNWHFYTTMSKMKLLGESMSWGKTYLPLKHFTVYKYGIKTPNYEKFLKGIEIHENNGTN